MHEEVGHLGIFVSGKVAKKEGTQIASVLQVDRGAAAGPVRHADRARSQDAAGKPAYEVSFVELRLEDVVARLNRFERDDEKPFEAVNVGLRIQSARLRALWAPAGAGAGQRARRQAVARLSSAALAALGGLRPQPVAVVAGAGRAGGEGAAPGSGARPSGAPARSGDVGADRAPRSTAGRALRDALAESDLLPDLRQPVRLLLWATNAGAEAAARPVDPRELPFVKDALASIDQGGYAEALARVGLPDGAPGRAAAAVARAAGAGTARGLSRAAARPGARRGAPHRRRAGNHRALRTRQGDRDAARCCWPSARTASACSRCSSACSPTSACSASSLLPNKPRRSRASVACSAEAGRHRAPVAARRRIKRSSRNRRDDP